LRRFSAGRCFEIDMDEANGRFLETANRRPGRFEPLVDAIALQATMDGAAGEFGVKAAAHGLDDIVQRHAQPRAQFADQRFLQRRQADGHALGPVRAVLGGAACTPAADGSVTDAKFGNKFSNRGRAALDISPRLRCGSGVGMQLYEHEVRRS
jgi:hypothetical protein